MANYTMGWYSYKLEVVFIL